MTESPHERTDPRLGVDEWVARAGDRSEGGLLGAGRARWAQIPTTAKLAVVLAPAAFIPLMTRDDYLLQVAVDTLIFMLLALGLNVAVGFAGLLDLGYVAFFGFGAYGYALLNSDYTGLHWQAALALLAVGVCGTVVGYLVGLPSWRLVGDYLAIVTLFFLQIFLTVLVNGQEIKIFGLEEGLTRGPNGISDLDPMNWFGLKLTSLTQYFYLALIAFVVAFVALSLVNQSRTGRAWRALREEPLAAELMSMPVNWLKLLAFATGACVAALTGTIFAAEQGGVFPTQFDLTVLITLYAMVILGGAGSLAGVALGAVVINVGLQLMDPTDPKNASWLFYGLLALAVPAVVRPWRWRIGALVVGATIGFGFAVHAIADAAWPAGTSGETAGQAWIDRAVDPWVLQQANPTPEVPTAAGRWAFVILIAAVLALTVVRGWKRLVLVVPTLYLAACVWENVMVAQPAVARYVLLGALLVAMMAARPTGLLGKERVEIV
jgi:ABC-type branched-subunit amino acid transport system permease subunit